MKKRDYPLFMIDRTRSDSYPNDYITCLDREVGFVAKSIHVKNTDAYRALVGSLNKVDDFSSIALPLKEGGLVLQITGYLHDFEPTNEAKSRIRVLLKKALKKYLHVEIVRTPAPDDLGIDQQIKQQQLNLERAIRNYNELLARANGDRKIADYQIDLTRETIKTLERMKEMSDFFSVSVLRLNPDDWAN